MFHATVAVATSYREFELDDSESELLASHVSKLMAHYGKSISGETSMWLGFAIAVGTIEGPKLFGLLMHLKAQRQKPKQQQNPNVVPLRPGGDLPPTIDHAFPTQG